jgi:hypothetical protein
MEDAGPGFARDHAFRYPVAQTNTDFRRHRTRPNVTSPITLFSGSVAPEGQALSTHRVYATDPETPNKNPLGANIFDRNSQRLHRCANWQSG